MRLKKYNKIGETEILNVQTWQNSSIQNVLKLSKEFNFINICSLSTQITKGNMVNKGENRNILTFAQVL